MIPPQPPYPAGSLFSCLRCGRDWITKKDGYPKACGKCKSCWHDVPPKAKPGASSGPGSMARDRWPR